MTDGPEVTHVDQGSYLPDIPWTKRTQLDRDETLIVECLCRVIASADRFQTCIEAWSAIQRVRRIAKEIRDETVNEVVPMGAQDAEAL